MKYKIGRSASVDVNRSLAEATSNFNSPKLILFFSQVAGFEEYTLALNKQFPSSIILGATTFAAFCKEGAYKDSLLILGIEEGIECCGDVLEEVDQYPLKYSDRVEQCVSQLKNTDNTICLEFSNALIKSEELILSTLNAVLKEKDIPLFGGSAGDTGMAEKTLISFNGKTFERGCAFVLIKNLKGRIKLYQENIYKPTTHFFTSTKVDVRNRIVYEYDHKPAAEVMAKALNTTISELPKYLDSYPLGRIIGDDMYITANQGITTHKGMSYHARVYKNSHMVLLEADDYRTVINKTLSKINQDIQKPSLTLVVNCLARSILFEKDGYLNQFACQVGKSLGNYVGFAGYGEQLDQQHFNQTMIVAVFE